MNLTVANLTQSSGGSEFSIPDRLGATHRFLLPEETDSARWSLARGDRRQLETPPTSIIAVSIRRDAALDPRTMPLFLPLLRLRSSLSISSSARDASRAARSIEVRHTQEINRTRR